MDNPRRQRRREINLSLEECNSHQGGTSASTIDSIQNLKLNHVNVQGERIEEVPSYTLSSLVERPATANLRHLDTGIDCHRGESSGRQRSLPPLIPSIPITMSYSRSISDGSLTNEWRKRRRLSSDDDSAVLTPLYQAVSSGASLETIQSLVRMDPSSVGRPNGGGLTPLHCAIERYDTPVQVLLFLLESCPQTASQRCSRGFTPVDLLWKRYVEPDSYRSEEVKQQAARLRELMYDAVHVVDKRETASDLEHGEEDSIASRRQARAKLHLQESEELSGFWDMMLMFICAACHGIATPIAMRTKLVQDAVLMECCHPLLVRFASALFPDGLMERQDTSGRLPLHLACIQRSQGILQPLIELEPRAVSVRDANGQFPLHLAIQAQLPWEGGLKLLVAAWPESLTMADPVSGLLPVMLAATTCSTDVIFHLLCANPVEVCRHALEQNIT